MFYNTYKMLLHFSNLIQRLWDGLVHFEQMLQKLFVFWDVIVLSCEADFQPTSQEVLGNTTGTKSPAGSGICDSVSGTLPTESVLSQSPNAFLECGI